MSKMKELKIHASRTIQVKEYQPVTVGTEVTISLEEGEKVKDIHKNYVNKILNLIESEINERYNK